MFGYSRGDIQRNQRCLSKGETVSDIRVNVNDEGVNS